MRSPIRVLAVTAPLVVAGVSLTAAWSGLAKPVREWVNGPADLKAARDRHTRLVQEEMKREECYRFNAVLVEDLIAGRVRLADAAGLDLIG